METINYGDIINPDQDTRTKKLTLTLRQSIYAQLEAEAQLRGQSLNNTIENLCHYCVTQAIISMVMTVTPKLAKEWLDRNVENNRTINHNRVKMYAEDMQAGNWKLTHQGIAFDADGRLIDGQHRLRAVIKAGVAVRMLVMRYRYRVAEGALLEMDMGAKRTANNIFRMAGIDDRVHLIGGTLARHFINYKLNDRRAKSPDAIRDYVDKHSDEIGKIIEWYLPKGRRRHAPMIVAASALSALYWGENQDAIRKFGETWCTNDPTASGEYNSKKVFDTKESVAGKSNSNELLRYCENMIRAYANGITRVRCNQDCYPLDEMKIQAE